MKKVSFNEFDSICQQTINEILKFWNQKMQIEVSMHNVGWEPAQCDFEIYLRKSSKRYYIAYEYIISQLKDGDKICDIGGFWGIFPICLHKLGLNIAMTECLKYYSNAFDNLFNYIRENGVEIYDVDPFEKIDEKGDPINSKFDFITVMAVFEHYPHSLKQFMDNVKSMLKPKGKIYIEVPSIAYLFKRINLLKGISPLVPVDNIYNSKVPFVGHHHEYTMSELIRLCELSGFDLIGKKYYNYTTETLNFKNFTHLGIALLTISSILFPDTSEMIAVLAEKKE